MKTTTVLFGLVLCYSTASVVHGGLETQIKCPAKDVTRLDELAAKFISLNSYQVPFPEALNKISDYCRTMTSELVQLGDQIKTCLTGTAKQFANIILYSYRTTRKQYCAPKAKARHDGLISMARCINRNQVAGEKCIAKYVEAMQRGKRAQPNSIRIGYACCDYYKMLECVEKITQTNCSEKQTEDIQEFVRNIFQGVVNAACGDYVPESDRCDKLIEPPKKRKSDKSYKSYFLPLVELWQSLES